MAGAVGAEVCEIYTDVDGIFTADPRVVAGARKVGVISYEEMLELAAAGAKVLQSRSIEVARRHGVRIHVRSSFVDDEGTWVQEVDEVTTEGITGGIESVLISGTAVDVDEVKVTIDAVPDRPGVAATIFKAIAAEAINVDMIVQNVSHDGTTDMSFTAPREHRSRLQDALDGIVGDIGARGFSVDEGIAKISLVGAGMKSHPGVAADMFDVMATEGINIEMISTSPIRVSCVIRRDDADRALQAVHTRFGLDAGTD
jgi:aspartate kinase